MHQTSEKHSSDVNFLHTAVFQIPYARINFCVILSSVSTFSCRDVWMCWESRHQPFSDWSTSCLKNEKMASPACLAVGTWNGLVAWGGPRKAPPVEQVWMDGVELEPFGFLEFFA